MKVHFLIFFCKKKTAFAKGKVFIAQDSPKEITAGNPIYVKLLELILAMPHNKWLAIRFEANNCVFKLNNVHSLIG